MKISKYIILCSMMGVISCAAKIDLRNTVLAAETMARAEEVGAPTKAAKEYGIASRLFDRMNQELEDEAFEDANATALLVIEAANEAIRIAQQENERVNIVQKIKK